MDFFHRDSLESPTQFYSSVSEISNHTIVDLPLLVFIFLSFSSCFFLLDLLFFSGGSSCTNFSTYQPLPIACNNYSRFSFGMGLLGSLTGFFLIIVP